MSDTDPDVLARHVALVSRASPTRRAALSLSLSATVITLACCAIGRQWPEASEESERQWRDVLGVIKAADRRLQIAYLRRSAVALGVGDLLERAILEARSAPRP